jgi:hypothetical protein
MSCERILPLLPLVALDAAEAADARTALAHVESCGRCAASLRELVATRAALASFTVADSPATDAAEIRATAPAIELPPRPTGRTGSWLFKAAAAVLLCALGAGFAWTHGSVTFDRGAATLRIAWDGKGRAPANDFREREDALEPVAVATALSELEQRVAQLELRHEQDLLLLARSVDRQQRSRDVGVDQRIRSLEEATHDGFVFTNSVLDGVASQLAKPAEVAQH